MLRGLIMIRRRPYNSELDGLGGTVRHAHGGQRAQEVLLSEWFMPRSSHTLSPLGRRLTGLLSGGGRLSNSHTADHGGKWKRMYVRGSTRLHERICLLNPTYE